MYWAGQGTPPLTPSPFSTPRPGIAPSLGPTHRSLFLSDGVDAVKRPAVFSTPADDRGRLADRRGEPPAAEGQVAPSRPTPRDGATFLKGPRHPPRPRGVRARLVEQLPPRIVHAVGRAKPFRLPLAPASFASWPPVATRTPAVGKKGKCSSNWTTTANTPPGQGYGGADHHGPTTAPGRNPFQSGPIALKVNPESRPVLSPNRTLGIVGPRRGSRPGSYTLTAGCWRTAP